MKKIMIVALGIVALVSVTGVVNAEKKAPEKPQVAASEKSTQTKTQHATKPQVEKPATTETSGKIEGKQDRGLPKAFSGSEDQ
jgi:hypothetical protein